MIFLVFMGVSGAMALLSLILYFFPAKGVTFTTKEIFLHWIVFLMWIYLYSKGVIP